MKRSEEGGVMECANHAFCPDVSMLFAAQIAYLVLIGPIALTGIFLGYMLAGPGVDWFEKGRWIAGTGRVVAGATLALASGGALPALGYWLTFEGGLARLVGA